MEARRAIDRTHPTPGLRIRIQKATMQEGNIATNRSKNWIPCIYHKRHIVPPVFTKWDLADNETF